MSYFHFHAIEVTSYFQYLAIINNTCMDIFRWLFFPPSISLYDLPQNIYRRGMSDSQVIKYILIACDYVVFNKYNNNTHSQEQP